MSKFCMDDALAAKVLKVVRTKVGDCYVFFFFSSRRRHTRCSRDWSSDVCSSDLTFGAFLLVLISLTAVIWLTHALREIDLMTNQRQTILTFIGITGLLIPMLILVIAPLALVVAVGHTLNRLNTDSEIVVMNASGMSPWRVFRPFLTTTLVVSALILGVSAYLAPAGRRELRDGATT